MKISVLESSPYIATALLPMTFEAGFRGWQQKSCATLLLPAPETTLLSLISTKLQKQKKKLYPTY
jgi:hypothetical protein